MSGKEIDGRLYRSGKITCANRADDDAGNREIELSFSSEEPYRRWWGVEILGHKRSEVDTSFIGSGRAPLLVDHRRTVDHQVGTVTSVSIENGVGRARVRFGKAQRATEILDRVRDGEIVNVSVGYSILKMRLESEEEGVETYRITSWKPHEISLVTVPADETVGVGRSADNLKTIELKGNPAMDPETTEDGGAVTTTEVRTPATPAAPETPPAAPQIRQVAPANTDDAVRSERERIAEITAMGARFNMQDLAQNAVREGTTVSGFQGAVIERLGANAPAVMSAQSEVGLSSQERQDYSFLRAIRALSNPTDQEAQKAAAFEFEVSRAEATRSGKEPQGILVPMDVLSQPIGGTREQSVGTATAGGNVVANDLMADSFIEILRNKMMVRQLGATVLDGMTGTFDLPRQSGGASITWGGEGDDAAETGGTFDQVSFAPNTASAYIDLTRRFILQSSIAAEGWARRELATAVALGIDYAALHGSGTGDEPTGIANMAGIGAVVGGTNGAAPTWSNIVQLETEISADNADIGSLAYLTNAKVQWQAQGNREGRRNQRRVHLAGNAGRRMAWVASTGTAPAFPIRSAAT